MAIVRTFAYHNGLRVPRGQHAGVPVKTRLLNCKKSQSADRRRFKRRPYLYNQQPLQQQPLDWLYRRWLPPRPPTKFRTPPQRPESRTTLCILKNHEGNQAIRTGPWLTKVDPGIQSERFDQQSVGQHCEKGHHYVDQRHVKDYRAWGVPCLEVVHCHNKAANSLDGGSLKTGAGHSHLL